jgi:hypothetical protein
LALSSRWGARKYQLKDRARKQEQRRRELERPERLGDLLVGLPDRVLR